MTWYHRLHAVNNQLTINLNHFVDRVSQSNGSTSGIDNLAMSSSENIDTTDDVGSGTDPLSPDEYGGWNQWLKIKLQIKSFIIF